MPTRRFALLCFFVFFSGAAALGIEVVWSRMLQRILGSTATAVTLVVAGYLAGMGLGAHVGERCLARVGNAVRAYAACELVAAALVLVCTLLFRDPLLATLPGGTVWLLLMVVLASVPLGATFPFLIRAVAVDPRATVGEPPVQQRLEGRLRGIYGWNAVGAALGGVCAGLVLVPAIGEWSTVRSLVAVEVVVAFLILLSFRSTASVQSAPQDVEPGPRVPPFLLVGFLFLSGFVVLFWEVLWTRILTLVVGGTAYAFAVVTGSVVLGIGVGSLVPPLRAFRLQRPWLLPALVTLLLVVGYFAVERLPDAFLVAVRATGRSPLLCGTLGAACVVFLPNFLLGSLFPILIATWREKAGTLYALNSVGAVLGAFCAGPLSAGLLQLETTYYVGVAAVLVLTVIGVLLSRQFRLGVVTARSVVFGIAGALLICSVLSFTLLRDGWNRDRLLSGVYQWPLDEMEDASLTVESRFEGRELLAVAAGKEVFVSVERDSLANTIYVKSNGKVEGSLPADPERPSLADLPTQILLGELPLQILADRSPRPSALLIGLGSGVTLSSLLEGAGPTARPRSVDVIEIERGFLDLLQTEAARPYLEAYLPQWLTRGEAPPADPPTCQLHFGDARRLLTVEMRDRQWDIIVSQPSEPWIPGAAPLFTVEFFELLRERLRPEGVLVQWLQLYKLDMETLRILVRSVRRAFPEVFLVRPPATGGVLVVAAEQPLDFVRLLNAPTGRFHADTLLESPLDRLAIFLGGSRGVDRFTGVDPSLPVNSDDRDVVLRLTRGLYTSAQRARHNLRALQREVGTDPVHKYLPDYLWNNSRKAELARRNAHYGDYWEALETLEGDVAPTASALRAEFRAQIRTIEAEDEEWNQDGR